MELPNVTNIAKNRSVTGEMVYYDQARQLGQYPSAYDELSDMARQMYEIEADIYRAENVRPEIINEYEQFDNNLSSASASCMALADELLQLKGDNGFTFVDIAVECSARDVLATLSQTRAGELLAEQDAQLAIKSDGSHYPILDIKKSDSELVGVSIRTWGWNDEKYVFTNADDEAYDSTKHVLRFPSDEKAARRSLDLNFTYQHTECGQFSESISLSIDCFGGAHFSSSIWMMTYAETGYEGHGGKTVYDLTDEDIVAFGSLIAESVGNEPESIGMRQQRILENIIDRATPEVRTAIKQLVDETWPAQALYLLTDKSTGVGTTLAQIVDDSQRSEEVVTRIEGILRQWRERR
jgi:hypothetical protein